jgi:hypothetical protein
MIRKSVRRFCEKIKRSQEAEAMAVRFLSHRALNFGTLKRLAV